jgi:hypothetical protein
MLFALSTQRTTTKTPPQKTRFPKTPSKTPAKTHKKAPDSAGAFFLAKT